MADRQDQQAGKKFIRQVGGKEARKLKAQRKVMHTVWSGFGMMGLGGWSVTVPTMLGAILGAWMDKQFPVSHSWLLTMMFAGLTMGCVNAWHWVAKEERIIRAEMEEDDTGDKGENDE